MLSHQHRTYVFRTFFKQLRRATIQHPVTGKLEFANYRISKRLVNDEWGAIFIFDKSPKPELGKIDLKKMFVWNVSKNKFKNKKETEKLV